MPGLQMKNRSYRTKLKER